MAMGFEVRTIDQDVIEIDYHAVVKERTEDIIDKALEGGRGISETERHHSEFIMTVAGTNGCLWYIFVLDTDLVIARAEVEFGEHLYALDTIEDLINARERIPIFDG